MQIKEITDKKTWEDFATSYRPSSLLQSWAWGEFAKKEGREVIRVGLFNDEDLVGLALAIVVLSKRANYLEVHMGPMVDYSDITQFKYFHDYFTDLARQKKLHFFRFRPPMLHDDNKLKSFTKLGYKKAPMYFQAEHTYRLDVSKSEDELMKGMKKNTRYYVRKAQKVGVEISTSTDINDIEPFFDLYQKTVERQHFVPYDKKFFTDEFESFSKDNSVELFFAKYDDKVISTAMIVYYADTAYYHHGASIRLNPDVYASYLLQWEVIKRIRERGIKIYDFFGIAPTDDPNHPRAGLTKFKRGFGGERTRFMHTMDYPIDKLRYALVYAFVLLERKKRGL